MHAQPYSSANLIGAEGSGFKIAMKVARPPDLPRSNRTARRRGRGADAMFPYQVPSPGQMWPNAIVLSSACMHVGLSSSTAGKYPRMPHDAPIPGAFNGAPPRPKPRPVRLQQHCPQWERLQPHCLDDCGRNNIGQHATTHYNNMLRHAATHYNRRASTADGSTSHRARSAQPSGTHPLQHVIPSGTVGRVEIDPHAHIMHIVPYHASASASACTSRNTWAI